MKIILSRSDNYLEIERRPLSKKRFKCVCWLAGAAIGGAVLVALVHMLGLWGLLWSLAGLVLVGLYRLLSEKSVE